MKAFNLSKPVELAELETSLSSKTKAVSSVCSSLEKKGLKTTRKKIIDIEENIKQAIVIEKIASLKDSLSGYHYQYLVDYFKVPTNIERGEFPQREFSLYDLQKTEVQSHQDQTPINRSSILSSYRPFWIPMIKHEKESKQSLIRPIPPGSVSRSTTINSNKSRTISTAQDSNMTRGTRKVSAQSESTDNFLRTLYLETNPFDELSDKSEDEGDPIRELVKIFTDWLQSLDLTTEEIAKHLQKSFDYSYGIFPPGIEAQEREMTKVPKDLAFTWDPQMYSARAALTRQIQWDKYAYDLMGGEKDPLKEWYPTGVFKCEIEELASLKKETLTKYLKLKQGVTSNLS